jgi:hypothetical protein
MTEYVRDAIKTLSNRNLTYIYFSSNIYVIYIIKFHEEHRLRVFENRVLRRIFGPKRDEVTGDWRKLHNEELHNLYSSPNIIRMIKSRRMRRAGQVARMGKRGCI